ncbi:hypothetical protein L6164_005255 [Bauhinia variegata]|uniref:Uncharacterized protein n=1 Tax=Bauhinia variegata TaxID=167791 RepID=A0ACB9PQ26_BAUVA|nr:hypothetical protein L6164_005255 [Bauhinia variegata]
MYRSFMTCNDPKGVAECGTIKRVKSSGQKMEEKTKNRITKDKNSDTCLTNKADKQEMAPKGKGSLEKSHDQSCLQLMEVSRGAERLNIMIDSWSRGIRHDRGSENIAKDLLKGALNLQESLFMLQKFQEASQDMARLKSIQNEKAERVRIDTKLIDATHADQYCDHSYPMGFQRHRLSADAASRNGTEELKEVIRNSLVRQNLLPSTSTEGLDSTSEILSTSSSQSFHTDRLSDSSFSSAASKQEKGPKTNLVAKLMGLESFPPRPFPASVQKQLEGEKILNQKRPVFEIDMPNVRKTDSVVHKVDPARKKTLREILETMHFKGLLKKSSVKEPKLQIHHFDDPHSKKYSDLPPIVLMKPRYPESVLPETLSPRKLKSEVFPSKTIKHKERNTKMDKKMEQEDVTKRLTREERPKLKEFKLKPKVQVSEKTDQKAKVKIITRKLPDKEIPKPRSVARSQEQGEIASTKKISKPRNVLKSRDEGQITSIKREISEPKIVARSQDEEETTSTKLRKPRSGSRINKNDISCQRSTAPNAISKTKTQKVTNSKDKKKNQMKKQRHVAEDEADKPVVEQSGHEEEKMIDVPCKDDCTEIRTTTILADELPVEHSAEVSVYNTGEEDHKQNQSSLGDGTLLKSEHEDVSTPAEEAHDGVTCGKTHSKSGKVGDELKYLLLTSETFINHAEELLNLDVDSAMILQKYDTNEMANLRLYLDCANELTERRSQKESQIVHPLLLTCAGKSRVNISLGMLVEEICIAIENLKLYSKISGEKPSVDDLFAMMERDIQCNGLINGIWDWGWRHIFSAVEAEQVVNDVENLVLSELIEEVIT